MTINQQATECGHPHLTVCVIGRNEVDNIPRVGQSLRQLDNLGINIQKIYVDSASTDKSVEYAKKYFDEIYILADSPHLCPAAGRFVGTSKAKADWILYLDADVALCDSFNPLLLETITNASRIGGVVGQYINRYPDGSQRSDYFRDVSDGNPARHFSGRVLLSRRAVLACGNWNPSIYSNEEIELLCRLRAAGYPVIKRNVLTHIHFTDKLSISQKIIRNFIPVTDSVGSIPKRFLGFGQVLAANCAPTSLWNLMRFFPYPFVYIGMLLVSFLLLLTGNAILAIAILSFAILYVSSYKGMQFCIVYLGFIVQGLFGLFRYSADYRPAVTYCWSKN